MDWSTRYNPKDFDLPAIWRKVSSTGNSECWKIELIGQLWLGNMSAQITWLKDAKEGTLSLYRDGNFVCMVPVEACSPQANLDTFKNAAWETILDYLSIVSVNLQNYIAAGLKTYPTPLSEDA